MQDYKRKIVSEKILDETGKAFTIDDDNKQSKTNLGLKIFAPPKFVVTIDFLRHT